MITEGLFSVILGTTVPIDDSVFVVTTRWLGIQVGADPEISPRTRIVSAAYANRIATVDGAAGGEISNDVIIQNDLFVSGKATIGSSHTNTGLASFVGGDSNTIAANYSIIGNGRGNEVYGDYSMVGGGIYNNIGIECSSAVIVGGSEQFIGSGNNSAICGGSNNVLEGDFNIICGGSGNVIESESNNNTIGGGEGNGLSGNYNVICGGQENIAGSNSHNMIGGGIHNQIGFASYCAIPGGAENNIEGPRLKNKFQNEFSLIFGYQVKCVNSYEVILFDGVNHGSLRINRDSDDGNAFGTIHVGTDTSNGNGAYLTKGGVWTDAGSPKSKEDFQRLNSKEILDYIINIPIGYWEYEATGENHISPLTENFQKTFDVGLLKEDGTRDTHHIAAGDVASVALIGVQELSLQMLAKDERIEQLESQITQLQKQVEEFLSR